MYNAAEDKFQVGEALKPYEALLVEEGLITSDQMAIANISKENLGLDLGSILIKKGYVSEKQLLEFFAHHSRIPFISLKNFTIDPEVVRQIPLHLAKQHKLIPVAKKEEKVWVVMANPFDTFAMDDLKDLFESGEFVKYLGSAKEILETIDHYFEGATQEDNMALAIQVTSDIEHSGNDDARKMQAMASGTRVVAAVNNVIARAHAEKASDIHIEPSRKRLRIRFRVDGLLRERGSMAKNMLLPIVSRIKILAGLDIAEHRVPQDGRVRILLVGKPVDMRISTCPTQFGEKVVIRLHTQDEIRNVETMGFKEEDRKLFSDIISKSHGIFLATGPTGSGKSTTLYAALARINSSEKNIISIEDPIESELEGINQVEVNTKAGVTFAAVLRSVLRQDPDVIMIGEIRDAETAQIAVRAAITGHMVLSTLHTNTASGAISRLMDLGVEPFLLSTALKGVLAQRLVRKICPNCRQEVSIDSSRFGELGKMAQRAFLGKGCKSCNFTGYAGRLGIFELAAIDEKVRRLINNKAPDNEISKAFRDMGVKSIIEDGAAKINEGLTSLEEVLRVTCED